MSTPVQAPFNVNIGTDGTSKIPLNASNTDIRSLVFEAGLVSGYGRRPVRGSRQLGLVPTSGYETIRLLTAQN